MQNVTDEIISFWHPDRHTHTRQNLYILALRAVTNTIEAKNIHRNTWANPPPKKNKMLDFQKIIRAEMLSVIIDRVAGAIIRFVASVCVCVQFVCGHSPVLPFDL